MRVNISVNSTLCKVNFLTYCTRVSNIFLMKKVWPPALALQLFKFMPRTVSIMYYISIRRKLVKSSNFLMPGMYFLQGKKTYDKGRPSFFATLPLKKSTVGFRKRWFHVIFVEKSAISILQWRVETMILLLWFYVKWNLAILGAQELQFCNFGGTEFWFLRKFHK